MARITNEYVLTKLQEQFGGSIVKVDEPYGLLSIEIKADALLTMVEWLKEHPELQFIFLTDICGIHFPERKGNELGVIYHLHSLVNNFRLRIRCLLPDGDAKIESLTPLFAGANWMERETFDFYGIQFQNHPDLKRILNADEMDYHPLRKEYPLEDGTRTDKDDKYFGR